MTARANPEAADAHPADLAVLAAHIAEDEAATVRTLPDRDDVAAFAEGIIDLLFPDGREAPRTPAGVQAELEARCQALVPVLEPHPRPAPRHAASGSPTRSTSSLPQIHEQLTLDAQAIEAGDPAAHGTAEVVLAYPGFLAIAFYRIAHALHRQEIPLVPRMVAEIAHSRTGADIHPAARIGRRCCIDHGTGLVIGETAVIGDDVKLYQGVTLGALSVTKEAVRDQAPPHHRGRGGDLRQRHRSSAATPSSARTRSSAATCGSPTPCPPLPRVPPEPGPASGPWPRWPTPSTS